MPLTQEQLALLPDDVRAEVLRLQADELRIKEYVGEIFANPEARQSFVKVNEKVSPARRLTIPADPLDAYVTPLKTEIGELKGQLKQNAEDKQREAIQNKMMELGIPQTDIEKVGAFQEEHGISNPIKAIELYAKTMEREPEPVAYRGNVHNFKAAPDEETATKTAFDEITNYRRTMGGR